MNLFKTATQHSVNVPPLSASTFLYQVNVRWSAAGTGKGFYRIRAEKLPVRKPLTSGSYTRLRSRQRPTVIEKDEPEFELMLYASSATAAKQQVQSLLQTSAFLRSLSPVSIHQMLIQQ